MNPKRIITYLLNYMAGKSQLYQNVLKQLSQSDIKLREAERRAEFHAERAINFQEESSDLRRQLMMSKSSKTIKNYAELKLRTKKIKQPFLILDPVDRTIIYASNISTSGKIKGLFRRKKYGTLLADGSYLSDERYESDKLVIGGQIYSTTKLTSTRGFLVAHLKHEGKLEEILSKNQTELAKVKRT